MRLTIGRKEITQALMDWFDKRFPNNPTRSIADDYNIPYGLTFEVDEEPEVAQPSAPPPLSIDDDVPL